MSASQKLTFEPSLYLFFLSQALDEVQIPEGALKFDISAQDIAKALSNQDLEVEPTKVGQGLRG